MGFQRIRQPAVRAKAAMAVAVLHMVTAEEVAAVMARHADPFGVAHGCTNPAGHFAIRSAGDVVCAHCEKVFWR